MSAPRGVRVPPKGWLIALLALAVAAICVFGLIRIRDNSAKSVNTVGGAPTSTATTVPSATSTSPTPSTKPSASVTPTCANPSDLFNVQGADLDTLPPDCGVTVVPAGGTASLGLGCGGKYPTIMFKTTTATSKTTICGTNSSGEDLRMVTEPNGGAALDMKAAYESGLDAFVAKMDGSTYIVEAYNGSLTVKKDGSKDRQNSRDWISLDNESDYD